MHTTDRVSEDKWKSNQWVTRLLHWLRWEQKQAGKQENVPFGR